ncbi:hypothetical protein SmJEL517_g01951 [Synchytrium microbalum]|uniref:AB hydrolase-1 domain-containing protein n=1 Tax=Synchytrium microbalum TaxID=1806994 RepID=A0A507CDW9_9FUNG|nr:uncharacterized protein SmJEL517_g01951 [Synchytrium microbalum]TPX35743.1 hypothetical protein SmJEL517_g01951 [Synchytrium microbalum]
MSKRGGPLMTPPQSPRRGGQPSVERIRSPEDVKVPAGSTLRDIILSLIFGVASWTYQFMLIRLVVFLFTFSVFAVVYSIRHVGDVPSRIRKVMRLWNAERSPEPRGKEPAERNFPQGTYLRTPPECFSHFVEYDFPKKWFEWNGIRIHYVEAGPRNGDRDWAGETFLFVHGNPSWSFLFRKVAVMHQLAAANHRVLAIDLIGFGMSDKLVFEPHSIKIQVDMLASFCNHAKLAGVTMVLHDWGGVIGLSALDGIQSPSFLKHIVLMDAFLPSRVSLGHEADFSASLMLMTLQMYTAILGKHTFLEPLIRFITPKSPTSVVHGYTAPYPSSVLSTVFETFPRLIHPMFPGRLTPFFAILFSELAEGLHSDEDIHARVDTIKHRLKAMKQPVLIVYGAQDQITIYFKDKWKKLLSSVSMERCDEIVMIQNAGHFSPEDNSDTVTAVIESFVKGQPIKYIDHVYFA